MELAKRFPEYKDKIESARKYGYSDKEIEEYLFTKTGKKELSFTGELASRFKELKIIPEKLIPFTKTMAKSFLHAGISYEPFGEEEQIKKESESIAGIMDILKPVGKVLSIPQHLMTAAISTDEETFTEKFARGIEPSEFLPESTPGILKIATDIIADPLNLAIGAGAISKLAKGGKIFKSIKTAEKIGTSPIDEIVKTAKEMAKKIPSEIKPTEEFLKRTKELERAKADQDILFQILKEQGKGYVVPETNIKNAAKRWQAMKEASGLWTKETIEKAGKWTTEELKKMNIPLETEKVGKSRMTDIDIIKQMSELEQDIIAGVRGEKVSGTKLWEIIDKYPEKELSTIGKKLNVGDALIQMKAAKNLGDNFETALMTAKRGEVPEELLQLYKGKVVSGRQLVFEKEANKYLLDQAKKYIDDLNKTGKYDEAKETAKILDSMLETSGKLKIPMVEKLVEYANMIKLTGLSTHIRALVGNSSIAILKIPEKFLTGSADALIYGLKRGLGKEAIRSVYASEAFAESIGMLKGFKNGIKASWELLKNPSQAIIESTKAGEVIHQTGAIGRGGKLVQPLEAMMRGITSGKAGFNFGEIVRSPIRLIGSIDVFFKELNKSSEIYAQAARIGLKEGRRGKELITRIAELVQNPTAEIIEKAKYVAKERVYQEPLLGFAQTLNQFRSKHPLSRLFVPFYTTPVNLLKQATQRTPLTIALPSTWKTIKAGTQADKMELIGKMLSGSLLMTGAIMYGVEGNISSMGSKYKTKRDMMRLTGWQPQSIKIGDTWISYRGFEPISSWLRVAGDIAEGTQGDPLTEIVPKFLASYAKQFAENPFLMGINDLHEAFNDPDIKASKVIASLAVGSTIPNILQQWGTRVFDPIIRNPKTLGERIRARTPFGISKTVKPLYNIFGEIISRDIPELTALGFGVSLPKGGRLENELVRLNINIGKPSNEVNGYEMNTDEYERFYILKGSMLKESLNRLVDADGYYQLDDIEKTKAIRHTINQINNLAKSMEFEKYFMNK